MASYLIGQEGQFQGKALVLDQDRTIGRDAEKADLVLDEPSVSREHAKITKTEEGFVLENLSQTNPLSVNGKPLEEAYLLQEGDLVKIGENSFLFTNRAPEEKAPEEEAYETIFEEEAAKTPSYLLPEGALILKVVSGPNVGAEFGLEKNQSYVIGKDPESADIIFNDLSVSKQHARITLDPEGRAFIEDLGSKNATLVNSKKIKGKTEVSSKDFVALGNSIFLVIQGNEVLETIYTPLPKGAEIEEEKVGWKKRIIPTHYLALAGISLALLVGLGLGFFSLFTSRKVEIVQKDHSEEIKEALAKFEGVRFSFNPGQNKLFLVGHVLTRIEQEELLYSLKNLPFVESLENNLIIDELVWKNMNDLLMSYPSFRSVLVHGSKPGAFIISGYVPTIAEAQKLADYLNTNFPYVDQLKNAVVIETVLKVSIGSKIIAHGLSNIAFELSSGELILSGRFGSDEKTNFRRLIADLKKQPGIRSIKNIAFETTPDMARIDLSDKYKISGVISKDAKNVSVVANNQILNAGDFIDGMKVIEIKSNTIYLEKDGLKYKIDYKR
ncbi:MAG: type III secretion system inner membrane ring subunit SctD [Parachlamydiales bacterium]|jgi:type III secretion system YscD/HrpQ family protein